LVRYVLRKVRTEHGLRLKDLEDCHISSASISNLERGEVKARDGTFEYLLKKLGLTQESLKVRVEKEKEDIEEIRFTLECMESFLEQGVNEPAIKQLEQIQLEDFHPLTPYFCYLEGYYNRRLKNWPQARKSFQKGIRLCNQHNLKPQDNILAACYNQLSICSYNQNNFSQAIAFVDQGLEIFDSTLKREDIQYSLQSNKVLYLIKSSQMNYAAQTLDKLWDSIDKIKRKVVVITLHKFKSIILRNWGMHSKATTICEEGIRFASINGFQDQQLDLLNIIGSILLEQNELHKAEKRFHMVLLMDQNIDFPFVHIDAHTYLAILRSKQKNWLTAENHANEAIAWSKKITNDFRLAKAFIVKGDILCKQMKWEHAIPYYQETIKITSKHRFINRKYTALSRLSRCFDVLNNHVELVTCMKQMLEIQKDLKITSEEDEIYDFF
jgi:tetratricopeptide (TPR) repeat protein